MSPRALVEALVAAAARYSPADLRAKLRLLDLLERARLADARSLLRLHEALCFLQAYPDDRAVLAGVDRALAGIPARVARLRPAARRRLHDSGIAGTALDYPFGLPMARWLGTRFPRQAEVAWGRFREGDRLDEALPLLLTYAEEDALLEGGLGWRRWLRVAKGGRRLSDLRLLLELLERSRLPEAVQEWLFESLGLPIRWRLAPGGPSRTRARLPWPRPFFHRGGLKRGGFSFLREVLRPLGPVRRAPRPLAEGLIESARAAMATRGRELHAFSHPNPDDVLLADPGRGLRVVLVGLAPRHRLPLEGYYAFYVLKNGVPVSYGGGWALFGTLELGLNIFESFRQGESAFLLSQVLRVYRQVVRMQTVVVDPYQLGRGNPEALRSGAFYFYHRLGFRPRDPGVLRVLAGELARLREDPRYRSPLPVLARLVQDEMYLTLPGGAPEPEKRLRARHVAALVTRAVAERFGGDRPAAARASARRAARLLGASGWRRWPADERRAFERMALVAALIPDLGGWPAGDRRRLLRLMRAKGGAGEREYVRLLDGHRRLRRSLEALRARAER
jgi:hypothetical protein